MTAMNASGTPSPRLVRAMWTSLGLLAVYVVGYGPALALTGYRFLGVDIPAWLAYPHVQAAWFSETYYHYLNWWFCLGNPGMEPFPHEVWKMFQRR